MKSRFLSLSTSSLLLVMLVACDLGLTLGTRSTTENLPTVTVPGATLPLDLTVSFGLVLESPELNIGSEEALVTFVSVRRLNLQILNSSELDEGEDGIADNFDFLSSANIYIRGDFEGVTRQLKIASLEENDPQIGSSTRFLDLPVNDNNNVFDFLLLPNGYEIVLDLVGTVPEDSVTFAGQLTYRIGLGI